jgi:hypothetical protein
MNDFFEKGFWRHFHLHIHLFRIIHLHGLVVIYLHVLHGIALLRRALTVRESWR